MKRDASFKGEPPKWAIQFFHWYCNDHLSEAALGDMLELYERRRNKKGKRKADFLFYLERASIPATICYKEKNFITT